MRIANEFHDEEELLDERESSSEAGSADGKDQEKKIPMATEETKALNVTSLTRDEGYADEKESTYEASTNHESSSAQCEDTEKNKLVTTKETKAVNRLRLTVICVLIISTSIVAVCVFYYTTAAETDRFEDTFRLDADNVISSIAEGFSDLMASTDSLSVHVLSHAVMTNQTWPFVTVDNYAVQATKARKMAPTLYYKIHPYVSADNRLRYEEYTREMAPIWMQETLDAEIADPTYQGRIPAQTAAGITTNGVIWGYKSPGADQARPYSAKGHVPDWQASPLTTNHWPFGWDFYDNTDHTQIDMAFQTKQIILSKSYNLPDPNIEAEVQETKNRAWYYSTFLDPKDDASEPLCEALYPLINSAYQQVKVDTSPASNVVGVLVTAFYWRTTLHNVLLTGKHDIVVVFENPCNPSFTYRVSGPESTFAGKGDLHESKYDHLEVKARLGDVESFQAFLESYTGVTLNQDFCPHTIRIYPASAMEEKYRTNQPLYFAFLSFALMAASSSIFLVYDWLVQRRQGRLLRSAQQTQAIVSSLFPASIQERLYGAEQNIGELMRLEAPNKTKLRSFLNENQPADNPEDDAHVLMYKSKPIADLFTDCTIMFGDLAGFTAWSSTRDPSQIFMLLETIYKEFDMIASRRRVFKVETVGDCYVAVCGLPDARKDHAVVMARFATDCMRRISILVRKLEEILGPDTGELTMRFGLHSGPVTAGVLRGDRARFQLFGDTVNTAARIESTGAPNRIHVSEETANLLMAAGKTNWLIDRQNTVVAKGKGELRTYWLSTKENRGSDVGSSFDGEAEGKEQKGKRLVTWACEELSRLLKLIQTKRISEGRPSEGPKRILPQLEAADGKTVLDEVVEIIRLPQFEIDTSGDADEINLGEKVEQQLEDYVIAIASMYRQNPFHNFEHACHVTMSVLKLLARIVAPDLNQETCKAGEVASKLHDHTYGITSDPLTQFSCAFSALIHDVDHSGVPNGQVIKEKPEMGKLYKERSVAEQNSVYLAWELLGDNEFDDLRFAIYGDEPLAQARFRQLVVNSVMATDIMDKELKVLRNKRWENAFKEDITIVEDPKDTTDRKATIVIEHLIQASDVAHTMQHWSIYRKWNERFFTEMYLAYKDGRAEKDPTEFWFQGEIGFFDFYIIPLARKLKDCGVFGVSSDEYLTFALKNKKEWELRGQQVVEEMVQNLS